MAPKLIHYLIAFDSGRNRYVNTMKILQRVGRLFWVSFLGLLPTAVLYFNFNNLII